MIRAFILTCSLLYSLSGLAGDWNRDHIISLSDIKYEREGTHIEERINLEGCFVGDSSQIIHSMVFYPDGTVVKWAPNYRSVGSDSGVYTVVGDTIFVNYYCAEDWFRMAWEMISYKFVIRDRNTIELIEYKMHSRISNNEHLFKTNYWRETFHFTPTTNLPEPSIKWKKKKWLWKSEEEWQEFLKEHKAAKKNKRKKQRR